MTRKLLVATRASGSFLKQEKILKCLMDYPEGITPKLIALYCHLNVNTVKSILPLLKGVKKEIRGYYKIVEGGDGASGVGGGVLVDWCFHNCILSVSARFSCGAVRRSLVVGLVGLDFSVSSVGNAVLRVSCDYPLNVSSLCVVAGLFKELMVGVGCESVVSDKDVFVRTIEFNKDYSNLRLDGVKCVTVDSLCEQFKLYQKRLGLRLERKVKVPLSVESIVDMLGSGAGGADLHVKLNEQGVRLERLTRAAEENADLLQKLLRSLDGGD